MTLIQTAIAALETAAALYGAAWLAADIVSGIRIPQRGTAPAPDPEPATVEAPSTSTKQVPAPPQPPAIVGSVAKKAGTRVNMPEAPRTPLNMRTLRDRAFLTTIAHRLQAA